MERCLCRPQPRLRLGQGHQYRRQPERDAWAAVSSAYNWQSGQFVYGVEADLQASGADDTFAAYKFSNPWFGTVRGRVGYAFNNILLYGTLGLAFGDLQR